MFEKVVYYCPGCNWQFQGELRDGQDVACPGVRATIPRADRRVHRAGVVPESRRQACSRAAASARAAESTVHDAMHKTVGSDQLLLRLPLVVCQSRFCRFRRRMWLAAQKARDTEAHRGVCVPAAGRVAYNAARRTAQPDKD